MKNLTEEQELEMLMRGEVIDPDLSTDPEKYILPKELIFIVSIAIVMAIIWTLYFFG